MITIGIIAMLALIVVPQYTYSEHQNNLKATIAEIESTIKQTRNEALTGFSSGGALPSGGYGIYFTTQTPPNPDPLAADFVNTQAVTFLDGNGPTPFYIDTTGDEYTANDIMKYHRFVGLQSIQYDYPGDCTKKLYDASIVFQPPRADVVLKGRLTATDAPIDIPTGKLLLTISLTGSTDPKDLRSVEVIQATGKTQQTSQC